MSEEANIVDDIGTNVGVELLCNAFVLHQKVLSKRGTGELNLQLAFANKDLLGVAAYCSTHHLSPCLRDAILEQRRLQAFLTQECQKHILNRLRLCVYHAFTSPFST